MKISLPKNSGVVVCYGGGVDSTAMLIAMRDQGIRPDLITFADTGAEKPETYEQVEKRNGGLGAQGVSTVTTCVPGWRRRRGATGAETLRPSACCSVSPADRKSVV